MAQMLFYQNPTPLDKQKHSDITLKRQENYNFAADVNSVPVAGFELFECSRHFPVFFFKNANDVYLPLALLSLRTQGHDLGEKWEDAYVPAYIRRYPFMLSEEGMVIIDADADHFKSSEGDKLFEGEGEPTDALKEIVGFLQSLDKGYKATEEFCTQLKEKDLFKNSDRSVRINDAAINLNDLYVIDEKKMHEVLSEQEVNEWFKKGWLAWAHAHLHSLGAIGQIVKRANAAGTNALDPEAAQASDNTVQ
jgi:hypothetical protein